MPQQFYCKRWQISSWDSCQYQAQKREGYFLRASDPFQFCCVFKKFCSHLNLHMPAYIFLSVAYVETAAPSKNLASGSGPKNGTLFNFHAQHIYVVTAESCCVINYVSWCKLCKLQRDPLFENWYHHQHDEQKPITLTTKSSIAFSTKLTKRKEN